MRTIGRMSRGESATAETGQRARPVVFVCDLAPAAARPICVIAESGHPYLIVGTVEIRRSFGECSLVRIAKRSTAKRGKYQNREARLKNQSHVILLASAWNRPYQTMPCKRTPTAAVLM